MLWTCLFVSRVVARLFAPFEHMYSCLISLMVDLVKGLKSILLFSCHNLEAVLQHWDGTEIIMDTIHMYGENGAP